MNLYEYDLLKWQTDEGLQIKYSNTKTVISEAIQDKNKICLSFSGGKDSLACLLLLLELDVKFQVVWFNSGYEYPETEFYIKSIIDKYGLDLREIKPNIDPLQEKIKAGFFDLDEINKANKKILSCWWDTNKEYDLVITGLRASESRVRRKMLGKNGQYFYNKSFKSYALYPVAFFQNQDVFSYIASIGEIPHPIYLKAKNLQEREHIRVNWYILSITNHGFYTFLKIHYPEQFSLLSLHVPEVRQYV